MVNLNATLKGISSYLHSSNNIIGRNFRIIQKRNLLKANYLMSLLEQELNTTPSINELKNSIKRLSEHLTILIGSTEINREQKFQQIEAIQFTWDHLCSLIELETGSTSSVQGEVSKKDIIPKNDDPLVVWLKYYLYELGRQISNVMSPLGRNIEDYRNRYLMKAQACIECLLDDQFHVFISQDSRQKLIQLNAQIINPLLTGSCFQGTEEENLKKEELIARLKEAWQDSLKQLAQDLVSSII